MSLKGIFNMTKTSEKLLKLGNRAIKKAQENNRKKVFLMCIVLMVKLFLNYQTVKLQPSIVSSKLFIL